MRPGSHLVLIGSAAVYGAQRGAVSAETPPQPDSFPSPAYAWSKLSAEHATRAICAERGVALTVLRPSIIYGPGAGGVLIRLRDLARRGLRVVLDPPSARQHLLHLRLFEDVLRALIERPGPGAAVTYVVADPFVVTTADLNAAFAAAGPRAVQVRAPVALVARATRSWQRWSDVAVPGPAAVASMLTLDNVYDAQAVLSTLGLDAAAYGRDAFDAFLR
jgi:nucleoside-diphosphate-sugar epimerase